MKKNLLIGIGNSAREDDGLGWAFVEQVEQQAFFEGDCLYKFQLNLEDAELLSQYEQVFFADACKAELAGGFALIQCLPEAGSGFSTHLLPPGSTLYLCQQLYEHVPQAWTLAIQGYQWELKEGLSQQAKANLVKAFSWFRMFAEKSTKAIS